MRINFLKKDNDSRNSDIMAAIVNSMGEGLLVVGKSFNIEIINPVAEKVLGVGKNEAVGKPWFEVVKAYVGEDEIPFHKRTSIVVIKTGQAITTNPEDNHYYKTASGRFFPVASITTPILVDGKAKGAVKVFRDITLDVETKKVLVNKVEELEKLNKLMVGRELKIKELKEKLSKHTK